MANPEDDVIVILKPSCSIDGGVAKMLGWLRGNVRDRLVPIGKHGVPLDALRRAHSLGVSLEETLQGLRDSARDALLDTLDANASNEQIMQKDDEAREIDALIDKAGLYKQAIVDELALGAESTIRIDHIESATHGETWITLASLDRWARARFGIAVLEMPHPLPAVASPPNTGSPSNNETTTKPRPRTRLRDQEAAILQEIRTLGHDPTNLPPNPKGKPGLKAEIKTRMAKNPLFKGARTFDKAWERLRNDGDIASTSEGATPHKKSMGDSCGGG